MWSFCRVFIWKQPKTEKIRNSFLLMAALIAGLGCLSYLMILPCFLRVILLNITLLHQFYLA